MRNLTRQSIYHLYMYLLEESSCQISSRFDLKWRSLRLFL